MSRDFPVKGLADLDKYLSALPGRMQKQAYRSALTAAAAPIRDEARVRAPKKTGQLAKSIKSGSARQNQDGTFSIRVGLYGAKSGGNNHAYLGMFHEYGVRPHRITVSDEALSEVEGRLKPLKNGRKRSRSNLTKWANKMERGGSLVISGKFVGESVMHPGHAAHPFMRPALDAKAEDAVKAFATRIRAFLEGKTGFVAPMDEAA